GGRRGHGKTVFALSSPITTLHCQPGTKENIIFLAYANENKQLICSRFFQVLRYSLQVCDKTCHLLLPIFIGLGSQDRRWMHGSDDRSEAFHMLQRPTLLGHLETRSQQRLRGGCA